MSPDDFFGRVPFQAFGAAVPADDVAARIEEEDRVVLHVLDHQAQTLFALLELLFRAPAVREIAGDLDEAAHPAVRPANRRQHHVRPEARAILAHAPALVLDAALGGGDLQQPLRPAGEPVLFRVEPVKALADDLVRRVSLQLLRAGVPGQDATRGIEQENGVVPNAVGDRPQLLRVSERF